MKMLGRLLNILGSSIHAHWQNWQREKRLADQIAKAEEAGRQARAKGPCAQAVQYDAERDLIEFALTNGGFFSVPPYLIQGLQDATPEQLQDVWLDQAGLSVHWPSLDADFSIPGLLEGIFGTKTWMALSPDASKSFMEALNNTSEPSDKIKKAVVFYKKSIQN